MKTLFREEDDNRFDRLKKIGATALAFTAGVVAFNKAGGAKILSQEMPRLANAFKGAQDDIGARAYKDIHGRGKEVFKSAANAFKKGYNEYTPSGIDIDLSRRNLASHLNQGLKLKGNPRAQATKEFNQHLKANMMRALREDDRLENISRKKLDNIVDHAFTHLSDSMPIRDRDGKVVLSNKFKDAFLTDDFNHEQKQIIEDFLVEKMSKRTADVDAYITENAHAIRGIGDKMLDEAGLRATQNGGFFERMIQATETASKISQEKGSKTGQQVSDLGTDLLTEIRKKKREVLKQDRVATVDDILANRKKFKDVTIGQGEEQRGLIDYLQERVEQSKGSFGTLVFDDAIRIGKDGDIYSVSDAKNMQKKFLDKVLHTGPGKLLKPLQQMSQEAKMPAFHYFGEGSTDYIASAVFEGSKGTTLLNKSYYKIHNKFYKREVGGLTELGSADNFTMVSGKFEMPVRMLKYMSGDVDQIKQSDGFLFNTLGLGNSTKLNNAQKKVGKKYRELNDEWLPNILKNMRSNISNMKKDMSTIDASEMSLKDKSAIKEEMVANFFGDVKSLNSHFQQTTEKPSKTLQNAVRRNLKEEDRFSYLIDNVLNLNDNDLVRAIGEETLFTQESSSFLNKDLDALVTSFKKDPVAARESIKIGTRNINGNTFTRSETFEDSIRKEVFKEGLLRYKQDYGQDALTLLIDNVKTNTHEVDQLKKLTYWSIIQEAGSIYSNEIDSRSGMALVDNFEQMAKVFAGGKDKNGAYTRGGLLLEQLQQDVEKLVRSDLQEDIPFFTDRQVRELAEQNIEVPIYLQKSNIEKAHRPESNILLRRAATPMSVLRNLNDETLAKAEFKRMFTQFTAGRNNMEDVTTATLYPYFSLFRLSDGLSAISSGIPDWIPGSSHINLPKLNFGAQDTGSVVDLAKNMAMKWMLPAVGVAYGASYLNYESEKILGTSLTGMFANGIANVSLGARHITDKIGLTDYFKSAWYSSPMLQYMFEDPYRSEDEQRDWYQNGYSAVRKARWWAFGSSAEFRGGKIEYYEPNYVKRANTAWKDIGVYGSSDAKWAHSWIPTLRYPLAPLTKLIDPYWLERRNKYSRPYPVSGKMFGEGYPFSGILNATVGNVLKPQKELHRGVLTGKYIDVRDLIKMNNETTKQKALNRRATFALDTSSSATIYESAQYVPPALQGKMFAQGSSHHSFDSNPGTGFWTQSSESWYDTNGSNIPEPEQQQIDYGPSDYVSFSAANSTTSWLKQLLPRDKITFVDKRMIRFANSSPVSREIIAEQNTLIRERANKTSLIREVTDLSARDNIDLLRDSSVQSQLRNSVGTKDYIRDTFYSAQQISGIYGFMFEEILPSKKSYGLAQADQMNSFSRRFWDDSVGGTGGDFMEIARRFFPHTDRSIERLNPIRNNMPDWMPERFKHGDPYTLVKKGEMRLPGKAYSALNNIKPDYDFSIHPYMMGASEDELYNYFLNKSENDHYFDSLGQQEVDVSQSQLLKTQKNAERAKKRITRGLSKGIIHEGAFYSDFDRFKILADVSPWGEEYEHYKQLASQDTERKKEYEATLKRVEKQSKTKQFFNYNYIGTKWTKRNVVVDSVTGLNFTVIGDNRTYTLAGLKGNVDPEQMASYLSPGDNITIEYLESDEENSIINVVAVKAGSNINRELFKSKIAEADYSGTAIDSRALSTANQRTLGAIGEVVGHAKIPFIHSKFMRLETPLEAYQNDVIYGTTYSTWSHPIETILKPAYQKSMNYGWGEAAIGIGSFIFSEIAHYYSKSNGVKNAAEWAERLTSPGVFMGQLISGGINFTGSKANKYGRKPARIGFAVWAAGYGFTHANNPVAAVGMGALAGAYLGDFAEGALHATLEGRIKGGGKWAAIGAGIGLAVSAVKTHGFKMEEMTGKWMPENTKKKWELEEYFDRIEYLKYKSLFEKAAKKAKQKEGVDIKKILTRMEFEEKKLQKEKEEAVILKEKLTNSGLANTAYGQETLLKLEDILYKGVNPETVEGGEYTRSAIAYKQAMESTIFGLKDGASWSQIIRALPKVDREYFMEFAKETDPKKRKEILKHISPYKQRVLKELWGEKPDKLKSNLEFFATHKLPSIFWRGWKPDVDLKNYEVKTIKNEGLQLADFGYYESELNDPVVAATRPVHFKQDSGNIGLAANLTGLLNGLGLSFVDVSVIASDKPGLHVVSEMVDTSLFKAKKSISEKLGFTYY